MTHSKPIGITPDAVTEISVTSNELPSGQVKREKGKRPRRAVVCGQPKRFKRFKHYKH